MKKSIINSIETVRKVIFFAILLFTISIKAQYPNYSSTYNYDVFLQGTVSGGGNVSLNITNNVLSLTFNNAGFSQAYMKQGQVVAIGNATNPYSTTLPNTELLVPSGNFFYGKGYRFFIINNKICIYSLSPQPLTSLSGSLSVTLTSPVNVSNDFVNYFTNYSSQNRIISTEYLTTQGQSGNKRINIMYFDGLGRELESVEVGATPSGKDLIVPFEYDIYGRKAKDYLPIPTSQSSGLLVDISTAKNTSSSYYGEAAFAEKFYDNSPLSRVTLQGAPGNSWQIGSGHEVKFGYDVNTAADNVRNFMASTALTGDIYQPSFTDSGNYAVLKLFKKITKDEDWSTGDGLNKTTEEFINKEGKTVLSRKYIEGTTVDTYYVYDIYGNLSYVIPPLASAKTIIDQATLDNLCYQYKYDKKNRLVEKKLPGKGWELMVYDKQDRLIATQDAILATTQNNFGAIGWLFTKYDQFGRVIYTGFTENSSSRSTLQSTIDNNTTNPQNNESRTTSITFTQNGLDVYYSNNAFPTTITSLLTVSYYDTYPVGTPSITYQLLSQSNLLSDTSTSTRNTKGLVTASMVKNIENDNWTKNYTWYDQKARAVSTYSQNYISGYTRMETELDFSGIPQKIYTYHKRASTSVEVIIKERFEYDTQNRLLKHWHNINNAASDELLTSNEYNEIGQLKSKKVGGTSTSPLQTVDYKYNTRGWMTQINDPNNLGTDLFGYLLKYTNPANPFFAPAKYNGTVAEVDWKTSADNTLRRYGFIYDSLNRLNVSSYQKPEASVPETHSYDENIYYDLNGNIITLQRNGTTDDNVGTQIDDLEYYYNGNQLTQVFDVSSNYEGYPDTSGNIITYDANGNMTNLKDKGIINFGYNFQNLTNSVVFSTTYIPRNTSRPVNVRTEYLYRADGTKLKKTNYNKLKGGVVGQYILTTDYLDGFQYESSTKTNSTGGIISSQAPSLKFLPTSEGYYDFIRNLYIYNYVDHLGNVRLLYYKDSAGVLTIDKETNYYPFGMQHTGYNTAVSGSNTGNYLYSYNGKELQEESMTYDYGARFYMPDIGRWGVVDPLAEVSRRWTPYNYAYNNPVKFVDPDGRVTENSIWDVWENTPKGGYAHGDSNGDGTYNATYVANVISGSDVDLGPPINPLIKGIYAHRALAAYIKSIPEKGWYPEELLVWWALDIKLRPDIYYMNNGVNAVWELKPSTQMGNSLTFKGRLQAQAYADFLTMLKKEKFYIGSSNGAPEPIESGQILVDVSGYSFNYIIPIGTDGMIYYNCLNCEIPEREPETEPSRVPIRVPAVEAKDVRNAVIGAGTVYIFYKILVGVATWECGGCGVLVTP